MLDVAIISQIVLQIAFPVVLGWLLVRRYGSEHVDSLRVFLAGALSFAIAQATLLALTQAATMLGLPSIPSEWQRASSALAFGLGVGVLEELARFAVLRLWLREARSWAHGLMLGVGHGGAESVFSGVVGAVWYMTMSSLRNAPPPGEQLSDADQASLDQIVTAFFSTPWHSPIMAGIQQVCMLVHGVGHARDARLPDRQAHLPAGSHRLALPGISHAHLHQRLRLTGEPGCIACLRRRWTGDHLACGALVAPGRPSAGGRGSGPRSAVQAAARPSQALQEDIA
jgi:uncharacterized membrane protein YhfC